jgi:hypothetical protein
MAPSDVSLATVSISNDERGFACRAGMDHRPRIVITLEGPRSYDVGLARALQTAGLAWWEGNAPPT